MPSFGVGGESTGEPGSSAEEMRETSGSEEGAGGSMLGAGCAEDDTGTLEVANVWPARDAKDKDNDDDDDDGLSNLQIAKFADLCAKMTADINEQTRSALKKHG